MKYSSTLYGMPQESYKNLDVTYQEYNCMRLVLELYLRQKESRDIWAKTLWTELKPQLLLEGMEVFLKEFKQLSKDCRTIQIAVVLEMNMKAFKNSIPLFIELKNDAMTEDHWKKLMDKTGKHPKIILCKHTYPPITLFFIIIFQRSTF